MKYFIEVLKNYATFTGRARRKEYWMFILFYYLIMIILALPILFYINNEEAFYDYEGAFYWPLIIYIIATFLPWLAVSVRRLHDTGKSGLFFLIRGVPVVGRIIFLVWTCEKGEVGENQYGPDPKSEDETY